MSLISTLLLLAGPLALLSYICVRDHRARQASRRALLDDCASVFDRCAFSHDGDNFPRLSGRAGARNLDVRLISDTMTPRRLPQLWLQVTQLVRLDAVTSGVAILVRPANYEFYSLTGSFDRVIEYPKSFPQEVIVRGQDARADALFSRIAPVAAEILRDERVKEIAVTREGLRIIRQAAEGKRGDYLLLRQAVFEDSAVEADRLKSVLAEIDALADAIAAPAREKAIA